MPTKAESVSVIVPAFNGELYLGDALASIRSQDPQPLEIIVVDDGSTDRTRDIATRLGDRYHRQTQQRGPAAARNEGVRLARGELIAFLDQDDLWPPGRLQALLQCLGSHPTARIARGHTQITLLTLAENRDRVFRPYSKPWLAPVLGSAVFHRDVFDDVGFFDTTLQGYIDDLDWYLRSRELGIPTAVTPEITLFFRIHEHNTSRNRSLRNRALVEAVKRALERRRPHDTHART